ncbi:VOC family protein [Zafaria sp. Z1313]|uniref:VOC family protein n=1 Tax=unclassified Zafaria TaxID=2828765 RepID=UPI002E7AACA0|nr:VOC family protein [Zafaria sp. J156]MEE1621192.1 VOC family protein [Zafaria sp. J156]
MSARITARQFHDSDGVSEWRVVFGGAGARFATGSFARGLALVDEIGRLAEAANHHPDLDLRYGSLTVNLLSHDVGGLSGRDVELARAISAAARDLAIEADPAEVQTVQLALDALDIPAVLPFWEAVLGYRRVADDELADPDGREPSLWFQQMVRERPQRNRIHVDVCVAHDVAEARIAAAVDAGGRIVNDEHAPEWWTLADPEGNEVDIATMAGRG